MTRKSTRILSNSWSGARSCIVTTTDWTSPSSERMGAVLSDAATLRPSDSEITTSSARSARGRRAAPGRPPENCVRSVLQSDGGPDVNREFLSDESHGFLSALLLITLIGGALTIAIAIVLAVRLSKRITAPVRALTEATQAIAQGEATALPVTSSDELARLSQAVNRMTVALGTQRELRRRMNNDVAHELNTPPGVIPLEARGLGHGLQTPEQASNNIIEEVNRLRGLVTDLSWLAETDHGEFRLAFEPCSLYDLITAEAER